MRRPSCLVAIVGRRSTDQRKVAVPHRFATARTSGMLTPGTGHVDPHARHARLSAMGRRAIAAGRRRWRHPSTVTRRPERDAPADKMWGWRVGSSDGGGCGSSLRMPLRCSRRSPRAPWAPGGLDRGVRAERGSDPRRVGAGRLARPHLPAARVEEPPQDVDRRGADRAAGEDDDRRLAHRREDPRVPAWGWPSPSCSWCWHACS